MIKRKNAFFSEYLKDEKNVKKRILLYAPEFMDYTMIMDYDDVFPLIELEFENIRFPAPKRFDVYLTKEYGTNYMDFPRSGIAHHVDQEGALAQDRAKKHGIKMQDVIEYLRDVKEKT